jgi:hypothetical protein
MEKVIQEFRIIETDDGFRIEIRGDKEQLREWVMSLDPRVWAERRMPGGFPFGPPPWARGGRGRGPFGWAGPWDWDDDEDDGPPRRKGKGRGRGRGRKRHGEHGHGHGHHHEHGHDEHDEDDEAESV